MTVEEASEWLKEHNHELTERIRKGRYTPSPVRRVEIPKPDGGMRKLGIPTVIDRIIQQAMTQQLTPIYEVGVFGWKFWIPSGTKCKRCSSEDKGVCRTGIYKSGCS